MEASVGQKQNKEQKQELFVLASMSELSAPSSSSLSPVVGWFSADNGAAQLRFLHESEATVNFDLSFAQLFKLGPNLSICISGVPTSDASREIYSKGVNIQFRNEEESRSFHRAFYQWQEECNVQDSENNAFTMEQRMAPLTALSHQLRCPFPLLTEEEGERYKLIFSLECSAFQYFDNNWLSGCAFKNELRAKFEALGWSDFVNARTSVYKDLVVEFYTSFSVFTHPITREKGIKFRLFGFEYELNGDILREILEIPGDVYTWPENMYAVNCWTAIGRGRYTPSNLKASCIEDPILFYVYKFVALNFSGKPEANKINENELMLLSLVRDNIQPHMGKFVLNALISRAKRGHGELGLGHIVTKIAHYFGTSVCTNHLVAIHSKPIHVNTLQFVPLPTRRRDRAAPQRGHEETAPAPAIEGEHQEEKEQGDGML